MEYNNLNWNVAKLLLIEICGVIEYVRNQIKKFRAEKGLSQSDLSIDLKLTSGGFSKIESGPGKIDVERLAEIAKALDVNIIDFFPKPASDKVGENQKNYGYANKSDIDDLVFSIKQLKQEIALLKKEIAATKIPRPKIKSRS